MKALRWNLLATLSQLQNEMEKSEAYMKTSSKSQVKHVCQTSPKVPTGPHPSSLKNDMLGQKAGFFKVLHMNGRLTACNSCAFGIWKGISADILTLLHLVKLRRPFVTKLNISSLLRCVPNPQGLLRGSCGYSKWKLAWAGKQKSQGAVQMLSLRLFFLFFLISFLLFCSLSPPTPSSSPLLSRDNRGTLQSDRWQCHGKRRGERDRGWRKNPGLQNFPKYSQHISAYFVYCIKQAHLCISHIKVAVISPPSCSFVIQGSLCYTTLMLCWGKGW